MCDPWKTGMHIAHYRKVHVNIPVTRNIAHLSQARVYNEEAQRPDGSCSHTAILVSHHAQQQRHTHNLTLSLSTHYTLVYYKSFVTIQCSGVYNDNIFTPPCSISNQYYNNVFWPWASQTCRLRCRQSSHRPSCRRRHWRSSAEQWVGDLRVTVPRTSLPATVTTTTGTVPLTYNRTVTLSY